MKDFGTVLFSPSPFIRWTLSPLLVLFVVWLPFEIPTMMRGSNARAITLVVIELMALLLLVGFWASPARAAWAFRGICFFVFLALVSFVVLEVREGKPLTLPKRRAEPSLFKSLVALHLIGFPALWFAIFGRFTRLSDTGDPDER